MCTEQSKIYPNPNYSQFVENKGLDVLVNLPMGLRNADARVSRHHGSDTPNTMETSSSAAFSRGGAKRVNTDTEAKAEDVIVSTLQTCSHIARQNEKYFDVLESVLLPHRLVWLLSHVSDVTL